MQVIKSLFINNLSKLGSEQRNDYFIKDVKGNKLIITLDTSFSKNKINQLLTTFDNCMFNNLSLILTPLDDKIECTFINLDVFNYNPYMDLHTHKMLNITLSNIKNYIDEKKVFKLDPIIIYCMTTKSKVKYDLLRLVENMIMQYVKYYKLDGYLRLALYETPYKTTKIDITLFISTDPRNNELYLDELYFFPSFFLKIIKN